MKAPLEQVHQIAGNLCSPEISKTDVDFKLLFESLSLMFYVQDFQPVERISYVSPAFESLGYPLENWYNFEGRSMFRHITHPEDNRMIDEENAKIRDWDVEETDYEYRVYTRSGEMRWWKDHSKAILDENGERLRWVGVINDITDRKLGRKQLRETHSELEISSRALKSANELVEDIIGSMADMLISVDDNGVIERVNGAALDSLGYELDELIGQPIKIITRKETYLTEDEFEDLLRLGKIIDLEKDLVTKDGKIIKTSISNSLLHGRKTAAVMVAKDITSRINDENQLRKYALKLEQINGELEDFTYVASHDLQEPLRKIQAFGDRLQKKFGENLGKQGNDYVDRMRDSAGRMQTLINDLLSFSRVISKAQPFVQTDLNKVMSEVLSDLEIRIEQTNGRVDIGDLPSIDADHVQMRQIFQNLVGNALKFHRPGIDPVIKIFSKTVSEDELPDELVNRKVGRSGQRYCQIIVEDNGIGFKEKYLDRIFTVFQRLHGRSKYEGSGVGLAICRKIAERHAGSVRATSKLNKGSRFFVTLPLTQLK